MEFLQRLGDKNTLTMCTQVKKLRSISTLESELPAGFRFHPRDEELVCDYLMNKLTNSANNTSLHLIEVDLNKCEPWDIPDAACVGSKEWYFYSQRDRKYATGSRTNRATVSGYWKATGKDRLVVRNSVNVGMRKTLVFYQGRAPKGRKTDWVMHEYRAEGPLLNRICSNKQEDWVLCRVVNKKSQVGAKQSMGSSYDDETSSSSLPPPPQLLMDSYITFDQTTHIALDNHHFDHLHQHHLLQVPCFSIFSQNHNFNSDRDTIDAVLSQLTTKVEANSTTGSSANMWNYR